MRVLWRVVIVTRVGLDFYVIQFGDEREPHEQNKKREREVYVKSVENEFWFISLSWVSP